MSEQSGCDPQLAVRARQQQKIDAGLKRLLVDGERAPDWFAPQRDPGDETDYLEERDVVADSEDVEPAAAFSAPCDWCSGGDVILNPDGTCPMCGYDW